MSGAVYLIVVDGRELFGLDDPSRKKKRSRYPLIDTRSPPKVELVGPTGMLHRKAFRRLIGNRHIASNSG
jgi:hypothetical protein